MEKTISGLNSKGWYRLLKVFFVLSFLIVAVCYNFCMYHFLVSIPQYDLNESKIVCKYGDKKIITFKMLGFMYDASPLNDPVVLIHCYGDKLNNRWNIIDSTNSGSITEYIAQDKISGEKIYFVGKLSIVDEALLDEFIAKNFTPKAILFDVAKVRTYMPYLKWLIFGNLAMLALFEIFRRVFYYVVLGTFKPSK